VWRGALQILQKTFIGEGEGKCCYPNFDPCFDKKKFKKIKIKKGFTCGDNIEH